MPSTTSPRAAARARRVRRTISAGGPAAGRARRPGRRPSAAARAPRRSSTCDAQRRMLAGDLAGAVGQLLRPEHVGRGVLQVAGAVRRRGRPAPARGRPRRRPGRRQQRQRARRRAAGPCAGCGSGRSGRRRERRRRPRSGRPRRRPGRARRRHRQPRAARPLHGAGGRAGGVAQLVGARRPPAPCPTTATRLARIPRPSVCSTVTAPAPGRAPRRRDQAGDLAAQRRVERRPAGPDSSTGLVTATASRSALDGGGLGGGGRDPHAGLTYPTGSPRRPRGRP